MITLTFRFVATVLYNIATLLGMTYNEVNILAYYLLIPLTWTMMLDKYIGLAVALTYGFQNKYRNIDGAFQKKKPKLLPTNKGLLPRK